MGDSRLQILPDDLRIAHLAAVLKRCRLHFGPDSGVVHLAMALGVPTVALFREQKGYKGLMPLGPRHRPLTFPCKLPGGAHSGLSDFRTGGVFRVDPAGARGPNHLRPHSKPGVRSWPETTEANKPGRIKITFYNGGKCR